MRMADEQYSIQRLLTDLYNLENHSARRRTAITRPYFRIELATRRTATLGTTGWLDISQWVIWYHSSSESGARSVGDKITSKLKSDKYIQGYLVNYSFPDPILTPVTVAGGELSGTQQFAISGVRNGSETLVSTTKSTTVSGANNGVKLQLPLVPSWRSEFDIIKIYASVGGNLNLQAGVTITDRAFYNTYTVPSILASVQVPQTTSAVLYKTMFVDEIETLVSEDPLEDGVWDTRIGLSTSSAGLVEKTMAVNLNQVILKDGAGINTTMPVTFA